MQHIIRDLKDNVNEIVLKDRKILTTDIESGWRVTDIIFDDQVSTDVLDRIDIVIRKAPVLQETDEGAEQPEAEGEESEENDE